MDSSSSISVNDGIKRTFNHDLNIDKDGQAYVRQRWPMLAEILIDVELIKAFQPHELTAKTLKRRVLYVGSVAVVLMTASLLGLAVQLWLGNSRPEAEVLRRCTEFSAIAGLLCAILVSRYGPWRRDWLKHRFITEVLRQWHFRRLLVGNLVDKACASDEEKLRFLLERKTALATCLHNLRGSVGQKMDRLAVSGVDELGPVPIPNLPTSQVVRAQLLEAYRVLRLEHQLEFAEWKLSIDDDTFLGISGAALVRTTDQLAGATLLIALALSIVRLFSPIRWMPFLEWAPFAAVALGIMGVGVRAWRDGMSLGEERETYQEMQHRLGLINFRWKIAETDEKRFQLSEEIENFEVAELRAFIRAHEKAQFLI